ncbi:MAG: hypothetical protein NT121_22260, partial [Chloroflexi bacterium]|nr:hypothetical protein [Chloroflexota bacterium]
MMQISLTGMNNSILWSQIAYLGSQPAQLLFLCFVLGYTDRQKWLTRRKLALLSIIPVLTIIFAFTNE